MQVFPKHKKGGVVTDVVQGTGGLIIGVIIVLVIVSTLLGANLFSGEDTTHTLSDVNSTAMTEVAQTFGNSTLPQASCVVNVVLNSTNNVISSGNYTVVAADCTIAFAAGGDIANNNTVWIINSTTTAEGASENTARGMNQNFTKGLNNISEKIPTILLIAAVVLLFGILVILVAKSREMGIGGGTSL